MSNRTALPSVDEIAKSNPLIDPEKYREIEELLEELRREGVAPREYSLVSPFEPVRAPRGGVPQP